MIVKAVSLSPVALLCAISMAIPAVAQDDDDKPSYSIEDVTACSKDAMRLCKDKLSDIAAIEGCMKAHFDELRPKCKARFNR